MIDPGKPHVVAADRLTGNLVITFRDGKSGLFTADLLYATLPQAIQIDGVEPDEKDADESRDY